MSDESINYPARSWYQSEEVAHNYIVDRYSSALGRYRFKREQAAVNALIAMVPAGETSSILDCPTGIGRWLPNLASLIPDRIVGLDASPAMLDRARRVALPNGIETAFQEGIAESLPFADGEFDLVFCHALFKHLPMEAQAEVLTEFARVTSRYVVVSLSLYRGLPGVVRRFRRAKGSYPVERAWFTDLAKRAGLIVVGERKPSTPVGVEFTYLLRKPFH